MTHPSFKEATRFWLKLGFISFGGPTGQIAIMHEELVEKSRWIREDQFLHALNYCMLLPGPEAQQLAIYVGWVLHGTKGGVVAGLLFVLPSALILWSLSLLYVYFGALSWLSSLLYGLKGAVLAIVLAALIKIGKRALKTPLHWITSALSFVTILSGIPYPWVIAGAAFLGWVTAPQQEVMDVNRPPLLTPRLLQVISTCLLLWWLPILVVGLSFGFDSTFFSLGTFFSKAAMVTFGGAYAVLPYVAQEAVQSYHWLSPEQMMDGLALAETTPGPLIMVLQFVGFLAGWHSASAASLWSATLGAAITTWVTFVPCFLWVFLGAPHIEAVRGHPRINAALSTVTAAVVGVILNLTLWFGTHYLLPNSSIDLGALALAIGAFIALNVFKGSIMSVVVGAAALGLLSDVL